ncbi:MAG: hypothetical protein ACI81V_000497 [Lentimonas sp.]|jgi:hypothetical protein
MNTLGQESRIYLDPVLPLPLLGLIATAIITLTIVVYLRERSKVGWARWLTFTGFRLLGIAGLLLILLNPQREVTQAPKQINKKVIIALDHSESMAHTDFDSTSRLDEAKHILEQAKLIAEGAPVLSGLQFFTFAETATRINVDALSQLSADGSDTRFHSSLNALLRNSDTGDSLAGILILSDGHDLELVNPARTALEARTRNSPIFTLPIGSDRPIRDASIRIASYQPYVFSGQHARIDVAIRLIGCEYEDFTLELYREGKLIDQRRVAVGDEIQRVESFQVLEETPGQYAYEIRLSTVRNEVTANNNNATTFLNVSDKKINLLLLEGSPYWDTNFTQRALWGNDKFDIDIAVAVAPKKVRTLRKDESLGQLTLPSTPFEFDAYDCVLLGNQVERLLDPAALGALATYVKDLGGNVIFLRGNPAPDSGTLEAISPVQWGKPLNGFSEIEVAQAGRSATPFSLLSLHAGGKSLRPLLSVQQSQSRELSTVLATARVQNQAEPVPTMIHRRAGRGQVLAIASTGFWRTGFHSDLIDTNALFEPFWDNLILWLISSRNVSSGGNFSVLLNTANLALGQAIHLRMTSNEISQLPVGVPIEFFRDGTSEPVERTTLTSNDSKNQLTASFTPAAPGIYRVAVPLPDGELESLRFAVYDDNRERTEVSVDRQYLTRLATQSGGRLIEPGEIHSLVEALLREVDSDPLIHREPLWPIGLLAWAIAGCFSFDWLLRRRSGLC